MQSAPLVAQPCVFMSHCHHGLVLETFAKHWVQISRSSSLCLLLFSLCLIHAVKFLFGWPACKFYCRFILCFESPIKRAFSYSIMLQLAMLQMEHLVTPGQNPTGNLVFPVYSAVMLRLASKAFVSARDSPRLGPNKLKHKTCFKLIRPLTVLPGLPGKLQVSKHSVSEMICSVAYAAQSSLHAGARQKTDLSSRSQQASPGSSLLSAGAAGPQGQQNTT